MGDNKISLSLGGVRRAPPPSNGVKRPRAALHEEDDEGFTIGKTEIVSHFDSKAGGAVDASKKKEDTGPLSIAPQANRDWRDKANARKRQKSGLPEGQNGNSATLDARMRDVEARVEASKPKFGLNTYKKKDGEGVEFVEETDEVSVENTAADHEQQNGETDGPLQAKTDDELALDALLGKTSSDKTLIIAGADAPMPEEDAFDHDVAAAPDMATLDDYARVPVEQFGAALLRGMGWKDGEGIGSQKGKKLAKDTGKLPERRAALLGIGAKDNAAITQEIGAWGKASRGKDAKIYNPVLIRDKKTGKTYTEEELEKKKQDDERQKYEMEFERKERDRKYRERDDDRYESRDRRKDKPRDSSRDRERDRDDRDKRRRHDDSETEEEYRRRKERERRSKRERDEDHDRERSHRHRDRDESGRDRHHDTNRRKRDRERDRDRRR